MLQKMPISSTTHNSQKTSKHSSQRHSAQIIVFVQSQKLDEAIKNALITNTISRNPNPFQEWVIKAIQLQETCEVRHGTMILSSGKSSIRNTLILAYSTRCKHTFTHMNPKTIAKKTDTKKSYLQIRQSYFSKKTKNNYFKTYSFLLL